MGRRKGVCGIINREINGAFEMIDSSGKVALYNNQNFFSFLFSVYGIVCVCVYTICVCVCVCVCVYVCI